MNFDWCLDDKIFKTEHKLINIKCHYKKRIKYNYTTQNKIDYQKTNWSLFVDEFDKTKPMLDDLSKVSVIVSQFDQAVNNAYSKHVEVIKIKTCDEAPWMNNQLMKQYKDLMRVRRKICQLKKNFKSKPQLNEQFKLMNRKFKRDKINAIYNHIHQTCSINNENKLWRVWSRSKNKSFENNIMLKNNVELDQIGNHEILRDQFIKSTNKPYSKIVLKCENQLKLTNEKELSQIINQMNNKSPGPDQLPNRLIKILFKSNVNYFVSLFNKILINGELPNQWKIGKLIYFLKPNKNGSEANDYRPITLLNGFCKIVEKLFVTRIDEELNNKIFYSTSQFGFKPGLSTVNAISHLVDLIKKNKKKFKLNVLMTVDISGAFDGVSWSKIINNLINSGTDRRIVMATQSLLINRRIIFEDCMYSSNRGCPQGGKASPSLWNIAINDLLIKLEKMSNVSTVAFADDLSVLISADKIKDLQRTLNNINEVLANWCDEAELTINNEKTNFLNVSKSMKDVKIKLRDKEIVFSDSIKYLGIILDNKLLWNKHMDYLKIKTFKIIEPIRKFIWLDKNIKLSYKLKIYFSIFLPTIMYASEVWYQDIFLKKTYLKKLDKLQRKVLNIVTGAYRSTNTEKLLELLKLCRLTEELEIKDKLQSFDKKLKKQNKNLLRNQMIRFKRSFNFCLDIRNSTLKHTIWIISGHGPFRNYLFRIKKVNCQFCRFCKFVPETGNHLLYECREIAVERTPFDLFDITFFEKLSRNITQRLFETKDLE